MTLQEIFDKAWQAFVVEKKPPSFARNSNTCAYRGDGGSACIIGLVMPDAMYTPGMDSVGSVGPLLDEFPEVSLLFDGIDRVTLRQLQWCHDAAATVYEGDWLVRNPEFSADIDKRLREFASNHDLRPPG